ncbi:MAG TPA: hypothetical protein PL188_04110 [Candidatus Cloacimonadota bacterium]|nr:hypothetical protein [Candidatus Cloacimonadota bacterium]
MSHPAVELLGYGHAPWRAPHSRHALTIVLLGHLWRYTEFTF